MQVICCTSKLPSAQGIPLAWTRFKLLEKEQRDLKLGFLHPKSLFCFWFCVLFPFILVCWLLNIFVLHTGHRLLKVCGFLLSLGNSQTSFSKWSEFFPSWLCLADFNCHTAVLQPHVQLIEQDKGFGEEVLAPFTSFSFLTKHLWHNLSSGMSSCKSMELSGALPLCSFGLEPMFPSFKEKSTRDGIFWKLEAKKCLSDLMFTL